MAMFPMTVKIEVDGIPAKARVKNYKVHKGTYSPVAIDPEAFNGSVDLDYEIRDRKGYAAPWLDRLIDQKDMRDEVESNIMDMVEDTMEALKEDHMKARRKGEI